MEGKEWTVQPEEAAFGNYAPGRYAWLLSGAVLLPDPVPAVGRLGLWEWERSGASPKASASPLTAEEIDAIYAYRWRR